MNLPLRIFRDIFKAVRSGNWNNHFFCFLQELKSFFSKSCGSLMSVHFSSLFSCHQKSKILASILCVYNLTNLRESCTKTQMELAPNDQILFFLLHFILSFCIPIASSRQFFVCFQKFLEEAWNDLATLSPLRKKKKTFPMVVWALYLVPVSITMLCNKIYNALEVF